MNSKYIVPDGPDKELIEDLLAAADNDSLMPKSLQQRLYQAADRIRELAGLRQGRQAAPVLTDDMLRYAMAAMGTGDPSDAEKFRTFWFHVAPLLAQGKEAPSMELKFSNEWARKRNDADSDAECEVDSGRFYIEHDLIHDRVTGKHVTTGADGAAHGSGNEDVCALLNAAQPPSAPSAIPAGHLTGLVALIELKFKSGNAVPVERITITRKELEAALSAQPVAKEQAPHD